MELPVVIPDTIVQVINALERDTLYGLEWKLSRNLEYVSLFVKCKFPVRADNDAKVDSSLPVNPQKKKKKPPSARRRARRRQPRFLEKKAAEKATSPKRSASQAIIRKEPESVPKELDLSSEIRDQERADQSVLVESESSSETSNSADLDIQTSGVSLPASSSIQDEQESCS